MAASYDTDILICGGGPVGLTTSIALSRLGVRNMVLEKHPGTTIHPKARNLTVRTVEMMKAWKDGGVIKELESIELPKHWNRQAYMTTFGAEEEVGTMATVFSGSHPQSTVSAITSDQAVFEPVWRNYAETFKETADIRFGVRVSHLEDDETGVTATVQDIDQTSVDSSQKMAGINTDWGGYQTSLAYGKERKVRARFAVACDGWHSSVRQQYKVESTGPTNMTSVVNVYFRADMSEYAGDDGRHKGAILFWVHDNVQKMRGTFQPLDGINRWLVQIGVEKGEKAEDFTVERCKQWIWSSIGKDEKPTFDIEILSINTWGMNASVANNYRLGNFGKVFMAGDAAHQLPPIGGFGLNTGLGDVWGLCWKLAGVVQGWAGDGLLETYEAERYGVAKGNAGWAISNSRMVGGIRRAANTEDKAAMAKAVEDSYHYGNFMGQDFGCGYSFERGGAVVPDGTPVEMASDPVADYLPTGRPGARTPHVPVLTPAGRVRSTTDFYHDSLVLFTGDAGRVWADAAAEIKADVKGSFTRLPLRTLVVRATGGQDASTQDVLVQRLRLQKDELLDEQGLFEKTFGLEPDGAVLVRPDGHNGWRARSLAAGGGSAREQLEAAFRALLCWDGSPARQVDHITPYSPFDIWAATQQGTGKAEVNLSVGPNGSKL